jgi:hypothetical protein
MMAKDDDNRETVTRELAGRIAALRALESRLGAEAAVEEEPMDRGAVRASGKPRSASGLLDRLLASLRRTSPRATTRDALLSALNTGPVVPDPRDSYHRISTAAGAASTPPAAEADLSATQILSLGDSQSARLPGPDPRYWTDFATRSSLVFEDRYEVQAFLARGGTSCVFRGQDLKDRRPVAIKVVPPPFSAVAERSLGLMRRLSHPNVLPVEHAGRPEAGGLYIVLPLLAGVTLEELRRAEGSAVAALLLAFRRACEGMAHAHERGVVHGDVKPLNIHVQPDGRTLVLDWDLASLAVSHRASDGDIIGTPLYMAPEQFDGAPPTRRSDVHAMGVSLYELLTGLNPWGSEAALSEVMHRVRSETPPPPSVLRPGIPGALDELVLRSIAKSPAERFRDAGELLEALEEVEED